MKRRAHFCLLSGLFALAGVVASTPSAPATYSDRAIVATGENRFAVDLFRTVARANNSNVAIAPFSVAQTLQSLAIGARGETRAQILRALHIEGFSPARMRVASRSVRDELADLDQPRMQLGNQIYVATGTPVQRDVQQQLAEPYGRIRTIDFTNPDVARKKINDDTAGLLGRDGVEVLSPGVVGDSTRFVTVSAMALGAGARAWSGRLVANGALVFVSDPGTRADPGKKVGVQRITNRPSGAIVGFSTGPGWRAVNLPYLGGRLSLALILPDVGQLSTVEAALKPEMLEAIALGGRANVIIEAPSFTAEARIDRLGDVLAPLGVTAAFSRSAADFFPIQRKRGLWVDAATHYTSFRFTAPDEPGEIRGGDNGAQAFIVDRPFLYAVMDRPTGTVLVLGRVVDPTII